MTGDKWTVRITITNKHGLIVQRRRTTASKNRTKEEVERWARLKFGSVYANDTTEVKVS